jgi:hypothetical protein
MHFTPAWAVVTVSAVTVAANVLGVTWAGRTQRKLAQIERLGERRTQVYVDLLRWIADTEEQVSKTDNFLAVIHALRLPRDLELQTLAFASRRVNRQVKSFQDAWPRAKNAISENESRILEVTRKPVALEKKFDAISTIIPEYRAAHDATDRAKVEIRLELLGKTNFISRIWARRSRLPGL